MATTWTLDWHPVAQNDLRSIPWRLAARADAAVMRYATTGNGEVARAYATDPRRLWLRLPGAIVLLYADDRTRILHVSRVFQVR